MGGKANNKSNKSDTKYVRNNMPIKIIGVAVLIFAILGVSIAVQSTMMLTNGQDGINGIDGQDGVNGFNGNDGFNGTAADYTIYAAPDNSWYVAVPGIPSLAFYNETDASTLLDKAILALNESVVRGGVIRMLKGYYPLTHAVLLDPEVTLQGSGIFTILQAAGNFSAMISDQGNTAASVRDIAIECDGTQNVAVGINSTGNEFTAENVWISDFTVAGISVGNVSTKFGTEITLRDCHVGPSASANIATQAGIMLSRTTDALLDHCMVEDVNGTGILINSSNGIILDRCTVENVNGTGISVEYSNVCNIHNGWINETTSTGISASNCVNVDIDHFDIAFCDGNGTNLSAIIYATISAVSVTNCSGGIYMVNVDNSTISDTFLINSTTGAGIYLRNSDSNLIVQVHSYNNPLYDQDAGTSDFNLFTISYFDGLTLVGSNDVVLTSWDGTQWLVYENGPRSSP